MLWPLGDLVDIKVPPEVNYRELERVINLDFLNPIFNTRAELGVYDGKIIYERYAPGITKDNRLIGWSMTKSVTSAVLGLQVGEGRINPKARAPIRSGTTPLTRGTTSRWRACFT